MCLQFSSERFGGHDEQWESTCESPARSTASAAAAVVRSSPHTDQREQRRIGIARHVLHDTVPVLAVSAAASDDGDCCPKQERGRRR